ncbi:Hsp90 protein-domain-containing protein [Halteromyces radiatus]|uniref:Hsp90 protein-domain-containing protein n=1 Tax=Halteromyces radiatus TaxID=101107 RepID=UPI002220AB94|nr:Hsp90 protein-domain-containing protein [Halteromyces radiatus]KAI8086184.1 Hsp90 protein-domain-containing protein [Halteromyces radiatus]
MKISKIHCLLVVLVFALLGVYIPTVSADAEQIVIKNEPEGRTQGLAAEQVEQLETEKFTFQTEISRLMSLIINSLYKSREIFLRELISNASDALDKIRFLALTDASALATQEDLTISIAADPETNSLIITDTGIGMTREQLMKNLGTIAKSGTSEFLEKLESAKGDVTQIGQFGVGFYSVFLVADKVTVASKSNDDPDQHVWMSEAVDDFVIAKDPRGNTLGRGTQITIHLKDNALEFMNQDTLKSLVGKYSEFINFPIMVWTSRNETITKPKQEQNEEDDDIMEESLDKDQSDVNKEEEQETRTIYSWERVNTIKPIWMRNPKDVSDEDYVDFYRSFTKNPSGEALTWSHYKGEGDVEFRSIIYVPSQADPNFFQNLAEKVHNVKLFVKRVFITDEFDLFPKWLSFLKGVVDADDLPLNVSRETLQKHRSLRTISKHLVKKSLDMFAQLAKQDEEKYTKFIKQFGSALKYGAIESNTHRKKVSSLLRFASSYDPSGPTVSLDSYVSRMKANQKSIYYLSGMSISEIENSPFLEQLLARGYEVLYMVDPIDEMLIQNMPGYNGKMFVNIAKGILNFGDEEEEGLDQANDSVKYQPLFDWLKETLKDQVDKVVSSKRLTKSPMAIVANDFGLTGHMERLMAAQGAESKSQQDMMLNMMKMQKKTLEINPAHPIIKTLLERVQSDDVDSDMTELVTVLYETTSIRSGYPLADINGFTKRVETIIRKGVGVNLDEEAQVDVKPAADKTPEEKDQDDQFRQQSKAIDIENDNKDEDDDELLARLHDEL